MISWVGFRQVALPYQRVERFAGESNYPLMKMIRFAMDGIFSFSVKPLQASLLAGVACLLAAIVGFFSLFFFSVPSPGWISGGVTIALLFIGGLQLLSVGVLGEYIGRIYNEAKNRPLYIIQERFGFQETESTPLGHSVTN
jgi:dolichol-phosphate mannosyltransferase